MKIYKTWNWVYLTCPKKQNKKRGIGLKELDELKMSPTDFIGQSKIHVSNIYFYKTRRVHFVLLIARVKFPGQRDLQRLW